MRTELLGQEKNIVKIKLEIEANEFQKAINKSVNELSNQVRIPGFRRGKVSRNILEMRFGRAAIYEDALERLMPENIQKIVEDYDLEPLDNPKLNITEKIEEGKNIICELAFEVKPEVNLPEIENLELEKVTPKVSDDDVKNLSKRLRVQNAKVNAVDRPVKDEDLIDVELTIRTLNEDGSESSEQPKQEVTHEKINLADQTVRAVVRDALIGHSKGDTCEAVFNVENNHADKLLAGKKVKYIMKIEGVSEYEMPELNQDFYKKLFGDNTEIDDENKFNERLRNDINEEVTRETETDLRNRAVDLVAKNSSVEVPEDLIIRQRMNMRASDEEWAKSNGVDVKTAFGLDTKEGREGYEKLLQTRAENGVRTALIIDAVEKKYDIKIESEDLEAAFEAQAKQFGITKPVIADYFYKNRKALERLTDEIRFNKIADALIANMKIKEVENLSDENNNNENNENNSGSN